MLREETVDGIVLEILNELMLYQELKEFYLVGGTALALKLGHRKSIDIDLFTNQTFDSKFIHEFLRNTYKQEYSNTAIFNNACMGVIKNVKIDMIRHNYPLIKPIIGENTIRIAALEDIAAMKVNAVYGSGSRMKDFIDLYYLLEKFSLEQILDFYCNKYSSDSLSFAIRSLIYFEDADQDEWPEVTDNSLNWSTIKKKLQFQIKEFSSRTK